MDPINSENYSRFYKMQLITANGSKSYYIGLTNRFKYKKKKYIADIKCLKKYIRSCKNTS